VLVNDIKECAVTIHAYLMMTRFPFTSTLSKLSLFDRDILAVDLQKNSL